jgi:uncharacterized protein involved in response to NO
MSALGVKKPVVWQDSKKSVLLSGFTLTNFAQFVRRLKMKDKALFFLKLLLAFVVIYILLLINRISPNLYNKILGRDKNGKTDLHPPQRHKRRR